MEEWLRRVCLVADDTAGENPAKELATFYREGFRALAGGNVILDTEKTRKVSPTLRETGGIGPDLIEAYVDSRRRSGFLL